MQVDTNNKEFQEALNLINFTNRSIFLTGKAGTGKSTFLKYVCEVTKKRHIVLAPTGIAAINAGGSTLHSFFKLPFYPLLEDDPNLSTKSGRLQKFLKYSSSQRKIIKEVELVIIDEVSMVRADIIDFIDKVLRVYSQNMREPFGGKQILLVGDVYQLEPVVKNDEREILNKFYPNPFFFSAKVFNTMELVSIELKKVYRQKDKEFVNILDHIRNNTATASDLQILNKRYTKENDPQESDLSITLATRRDTVDFINESKLKELPNESIILSGEIKGEFPESSLPTQMNLIIKPAAQIIFIKNDFEKKWVNGTLGVIDEIKSDGTITVISENGNILDVKKDTWRNIRYKYNDQEKKIEEEELGVFTQYPIKLAWAITVHKSQGLTFNNVVIDFTGGVFAGGQAYVALSRCTSLEGIKLKREITRGDIFIKPEIISFAEKFNNKQIIDKALKEAQADVQYLEAIKQFDKGNFQESLDNFYLAIHSRYDIEKPLIKRFIRKKLGIINKQKEENKRLRDEINALKDNLKIYAKEYYIMGNECIIHANNPSAAIKNYDKAIKLDPLFTDAWVRKGVALYNESLYQEAEKCFNEAVRLSPMLFKSVYNRGKNRFALCNMSGAISDFSRAVSLKPKHSKAHELYGDALMCIGDEKEAKMEWDIAKLLRDRKQNNKDKGKDKDYDN